MYHVVMHTIWQLLLVPAIRHGRLICGLVLFGVLFTFFYLCGAILGPDSADSWTAALFFCAVIAYIVPVFHLITDRTLAAFDALTPKLDLAPAEIARLRTSIHKKPWAWLLGNAAFGVLLWFAQSWVLAGSFSNMQSLLFERPLTFAIALGPLPVWLLTSQAVHALVDNASLFRRLSGHLPIDLLDVRALQPVGDMVVASTLMVVGTAASLAILWLGGDNDPWTTIPGLALLSLALVFLFFAPMWPIRKAVAAAKHAELDAIQQRLMGLDRTQPEALAPLLAYRREIAAINEWPLGGGSLMRFSVYLFIVPLTWVGAALIEILVDLAISG